MRLAQCRPGECEGEVRVRARARARLWARLWARATEKQGEEGETEQRERVRVAGDVEGGTERPRASVVPRVARRA